MQVVVLATLGNDLVVEVAQANSADVCAVPMLALAQLHGHLQHIDARVSTVRAPSTHGALALGVPDQP